MTESSPLLRLKTVSKVYHTRRNEVTALSPFSIDVMRGEFLAVRGASGCGKSTLLMIIGGMLRPTDGEVWFGNRNLYVEPPSIRARLRADEVGFVFQLFHLTPYLNVVENVMLPSLSGAKSDRSVAERARELIDSVGLTHRIDHRPSELSAGERQRVALARAMLKSPKLILADEPTGSLDEKNAASVYAYLKSYQENGGTAIVVTHGSVPEGVATRSIELGL